MYFECGKKMVAADIHFLAGLVTLSLDTFHINRIVSFRGRICSGILNSEHKPLFSLIHVKRLEIVFWYSSEPRELRVESEFLRVRTTDAAEFNRHPRVPISTPESRPRHCAFLKSQNIISQLEILYLLHFRKANSVPVLYIWRQNLVHFGFANIYLLAGRKGKRLI